MPAFCVGFGVKVVRVHFDATRNAAHLAAEKRCTGWAARTVYGSRWPAESAVSMSGEFASDVEGRTTKRPRRRHRREAMLRFRAIVAAISASGSIEPKSVVPAVATIAIGNRSCELAMLRARFAGQRDSCGIDRPLRRVPRHRFPAPIETADFSTVKWATSEHRIRRRRASGWQAALSAQTSSTCF